MCKYNWLVVIVVLAAGLSNAQADMSISFGQGSLTFNEGQMKGPPRAAVTEARGDTEPDANGKLSSIGLRIEVLPYLSLSAERLRVNDMYFVEPGVCPEVCIPEQVYFESRDVDMQANVLGVQMTLPVIESIDAFARVSQARWDKTADTLELDRSERMLDIGVIFSTSKWLSLQLQWRGGEQFEKGYLANVSVHF